MKVLNAEQSRHLEQAAVNAGMDFLQMMENAGSSAARFIRKKYDVSQKRAVVICGKGNNGGDGFVVARKLSEAGAQVIVILAEGPAQTENAKAMFYQLRNLPVKVVTYFENETMVPSMLASCDIVVDALYGIGFHGAVREEYYPLFEAVRQSPAVVISIDLPSGAICDTGEVGGACIQANYTVSFSTLKNAHLMQPAKLFCGQVVVVPIGIPGSLISSEQGSIEVTEPDYAHQLLPLRNPEGHKGTYGRLLSICGSVGMAGAAMMSAKAALRCGVGLLDLALPRPIYDLVASNLWEPVYTPMDYLQSGDLAPASRDALLDSLKKADAVLLGCGLGTAKGTANMVLNIISRSIVPMVIDADGINIVAENIDVLKSAQAPVILTPHPGEMARLMHTTVEDVQQHRLQYASSFAQEHRVIVVLKGAGTMIAGPSGRLYQTITGNAGLARGGSGDVLAGMIASFLAQGNEAFLSAAGSVFFHGAAGDLCADRMTQYAMLPTDMIEALPKVFLSKEQ